MNVLAFIIGIVSLELVNADVSHLSHNLQQHQHQTAPEHKFVANNGQVVRQSFNSNGDATYNSRVFNNAGSPQEINNFFSSQSFDSGRNQQTFSSCSDFTSVCVVPKYCFNGFVDQSVQHKSARSVSGRCYAPEVCCRTAQRINTPFNQDNSVAAAESTSEILTKEGYVVRKPSNQYLPSYPEYNPAPSNDDATFLRPTPPRPVPQRPTSFSPRPTPPPTRTLPTTKPPIYQRPYQPQPSEVRPVQYDPAPLVVPVGCAAALNCTNIQYCNANGVISKTPVILTPEQEEFRVPMTDCREPASGQIGKCCRDPDYVDPWPVGRTGQYVPDEINAAFDSGAYSQEQTKIVPVRVKDEGYILPQPSNNQNRLYLPPNSNRI